ncbi:MAG: GWxTD domain-containing protein [Candidatus Aminicenantales bacterium]
MKMKMLAVMAAGGLIWSSIGVHGQNPPLNPKHKKWLTEEVTYIITTKERDVFQKLESDEDRERFIEEFWNQRDPTPGTPRNEFREEHYRRIEFADKTFGKGTPFQGWRTERGRIYIILGPPKDVERIISSEAYPMEIWYYAGNPAFGQAPFFRLLFYQRNGTGDYVLYNPAGNSPKDLVGNPQAASKRKGDPADWDEWDSGAYRVLQERVSTEAANSVFSLIPGNNNVNLRLPSSILLAEVQKYPQKKVNDDYAIAILEHKPKVEVSYSIRFMGNRTAMAVFEDSSGAFFLHYVIVPETISFDSFEEKYFTDLRTTLRLSDSQGRTLFQQEKNIPIDLHKDELKGLKAASFQLYDAVPVIPGKWTLSLLLENTVTKEFTTVEKTIDVPEPGAFQMSPLVLSKKIFTGAQTTGASRAYQFGSLQIYPSVNNIFREKDRIYLFFQILGLSPALKDHAVLVYSLLREEQQIWTTRKTVREYEDPRYVLEEVPSEKLAAGKYTIRAGLQDERGREVVAAQTEIQITKDGLPGLWVVAQSNPPAGDPSYDFILGTQYLNSGNMDKAIEELAKAYEGKRDSVEFAVAYAQSLLKKKNPAKAREILLPLVDSKDGNFEFYETLGRAARETTNIKEAVTWYGRALSFQGNVVEALNAMGECYVELGDKDQAEKAFKKSLEINPNQQRIKDFIKSIKS